jgi:hypothetical protein
MRGFGTRALGPALRFRVRLVIINLMKKQEKWKLIEADKKISLLHLALSQKELPASLQGRVLLDLETEVNYSYANA